ncbi:hypothetical protein BASA83_000072 [Batrachochytrium salamandrivorans]|nr:hypothetical protein BASA83_000072 [Batrachochytrium salamandrivorans]
MGKAYYGLELVGGNKSHLAPLQTTINKGIRLFTGARLSTAIGPLLVETGIGSLLTRSWYHGAVGKIPALVLVSSDQTAIQEQILADTTSQTKDSQATTLVCIDGDSSEHVETLHRSKSMSLDNYWTLLVLQGSQFSINREHMAQDI